MVKKNVIKRDDGKIFNMPSPVQKAINQFAELMARARGESTTAAIEAGIDEIELSSTMLTITLPPEWHAGKEIAGRIIKNEEFNYKTIKEGVKIFNEQFGRVKSHLLKKEIRMRYILAAQPHLDGTPHWHLILFGTEASLEKIKEYFNKYFIGAFARKYGLDTKKKEARIKYGIREDKIRGGAAGAIAYISRVISYVSRIVVNKDPFAIIERGPDKTNPISNVFNSDVNEAARASEWASSNKIRRIRTSNSGVTVWRALRSNKCEITEELQKVANFAKQGDFARFKIEANKIGLKVFYDMEYNKYKELVPRARGLAFGESGESGTEPACILRWKYKYRIVPKLDTDTEDESGMEHAEHSPDWWVCLAPQPILVPEKLELIQLTKGARTGRATSCRAGTEILRRAFENA